MSTLNGKAINATYSGLIKTQDEAAIDGTLKALQDGNGNDLPIEVSTTSVNFTGTVTGIPTGEAFKPTTLSGDSQSLDLTQFNFFESQLTSDVTLSFINVPTETEFQYSFSGFAAYKVSDLIYQQSKSTGRQAQDIHFKPDGTQVYFITDAGNDEITAHNLSTPWDISTLNATPVATFDTSPQSTSARGLSMSPDGTQMYITAEGINTAFQYTLSTAFDITTATYSGKNITGLVAQAWGSYIKADGTKFFVSGGGSFSSNGTIEEYTLTTPFDLSTATGKQQYNTGVANVQGVTFNPSGTVAYTVSSTTDLVYAYNLSTAWDITTATYSGENSFIGGNATDPLDLFFKSNGNELYVVSGSNIYEYESIAGPTLILPASVQNPPINLVAKDQSVTYTFYTLDGGATVYLSGDTNQNIVYTEGLISGSAASSIKSNLTLTAASATAINTIAIGNGAEATATDGIAIGNNARAIGGTAAIAIGTNVQIGRDTGIAIGRTLQQSIGTFDYYRPVVIGSSSNVQGGDSIGIGTNVSITGTGTHNKIAIGNGAQVLNVSNGVAIGNGVVNSTANTVTIKRLQLLDYATLDFADDAAAATAGIPLGGVYHTAGSLKIRIV